MSPLMMRLKNLARVVTWMGVRRLFFFARRYDEANLIKMSSESSSGPHDLPRLRRPRILIMAFGGRMNLRLQYRPARVWRRARGLSTLSEGGWRRSRIPIFESSTCTTGLCLVRRSQADLGLSLSALAWAARLILCGLLDWAEGVRLMTELLSS